MKPILLLSLLLLPNYALAASVDLRIPFHTIFLLFPITLLFFILSGTSGMTISNPGMARRIKALNYARKLIVINFIASPILLYYMKRFHLYNAFDFIYIATFIAPFLIFGFATFLFPKPG